MPKLTKFYCFPENLAEKVHNLGSDSLKVILSNTAPNVSTNTVKADITELSTSGGYTAGGQSLTVSTSAQTSGVYYLITNDPEWTGSGGGFTFRYAIVFNDTPTSPADPLIGYVDYGYSVTIAAGQTYKFDTDVSYGLLQIS
jgi:hypothetical protein